MPFETNLVAIRWSQGNYDVVSAIKADIDIAALQREHQSADVTQSAAYRDYAVIVSFQEFPKFLGPGPSSFTSAARSWYGTLPDQVCFILIHQAEWESGLD